MSINLNKKKFNEIFYDPELPQNEDEPELPQNEKNEEFNLENMVRNKILKFLRRYLGVDVE